MIKLTRAQFIDRSNITHENKFDYSKVNYINSTTKVIIACKLHGTFEQTPNNHMIGQGCPKCGEIKKVEKTTKTQEQYVEKVNKVHNYAYDYTKTQYVHNGEKITITCGIHGDFQQVAYQHTFGQGCPACGRIKTIKSHTKDTEWFLEKSIIKHDNFYNYDKTNYMDSDTKLTITCHIHGDFEQRPVDHVRGHGCAKCAFTKGGNDRKLTTKEFIDKSNLVHNYFYTYPKAIYIDAPTKVIVTCPIHGDFAQKAGNHIHGRGCRKCGTLKAGFGFSRTKFIKQADARACTFYILRCFDENEEFYKIGITMNTTQERYYGATKMPYNYEVISEVKGSAGFIWDLEKEEKRGLKEFHYQPLIEFGGYRTECFIKYKK